MTPPRGADSLRILVPVAIRAIFARLAPRVEAATGRALMPIFDLNPAFRSPSAVGLAWTLLS